MYYAIRVKRYLHTLATRWTFRIPHARSDDGRMASTFHRRIFEEIDAEIVYLPHIVEKLFGTYPERAREAIERGHLTLRTRDDLPYGLAIFDERAGIGGYDEGTGLMQVFVDTDARIACEWADRVYVSRSERIPNHSTNERVRLDDTLSAKTT